MNAFYENYPKLVMVEITNKCNLLCDYCFKSKSSFAVKEMSWETFLLVKKSLEFAELVSFCGMGEQLLHPRLYDMVSSLEDKKVLIITNGTIPIDYERLMSKENIHTITFSVDGPTEEIAKRSCVKYSFRNLLVNLENGRHYTNVPKGINYVMGPENLEHTLDIFEFAKEHGVSSVNLLLPSHNPQWVARNIKVIAETLEQARILSEEMDIGFSDPYKTYCVFDNSVIPYISTAGYIRPCCDHSNRISLTGSLMKKSFMELWNEPVYEKFRSGYYCRDCSMYKNKAL